MIERELVSVEEADVNNDGGGHFCCRGVSCHR